MRKDLPPQRRRRPGPQFVGSVTLQAKVGLSRGEPNGRVDIQVRGDVDGGTQRRILRRDDGRIHSAMVPRDAAARTTSANGLRR